VWDAHARERIYDLGRSHAFALLDILWEPSQSQLFAINQRGDLYRYVQLKNHSGAASARPGSESILARTGKPVACLVHWKSREWLVMGTFDGELHALNLKGKVEWHLPPYIPSDATEESP
ncbi:MAG: hypothetical protein P8L18_04035, partial [Verrucomicrobiota bacterium]|nr:hypothetical protein [Verrucomicrobiota bacterium]